MSTALLIGEDGLFWLLVFASCSLCYFCRSAYALHIETVVAELSLFVRKCRWPQYPRHGWQRWQIQAMMRKWGHNPST